MSELRIAQITTPHSVGTGFYWPSTDIVVTNEHVITKHKEVVVNEDGQQRLGVVFFIDTTYDLAFVRVEKVDAAPEFELADLDSVEPGRRVSGLGFTGDDQLHESHGTIRQTRYSMEGLAFIQHDVQLHYGASGGPLILEGSQLLGVNSFTAKGAELRSFAIPIDVVAAAIGKADSQQLSQRCDSCKHIVSERDMEQDYCPVCGSEVDRISNWPDFEPRGMGYTIESLLTELGFDVRMARQGLNQWIVYKGSARIILSYHHRSGLILGESELLTLQEHRIFEIYRYLLQQNAFLRSLSFSMTGMKVVLSTVIHDQFLEESSTKALLKDLFEKSDEYDDILVAMNSE